MECTLTWSTKKLQLVFDGYSKSLWHFSETLRDDMGRCNQGESCLYGTSYSGTVAELRPQDFLLARQIMLEQILPIWIKQCEKKHPNCGEEWNKSLVKLLDKWHK